MEDAGFIEPNVPHATDLLAYQSHFDGLRKKDGRPYSRRLPDTPAERDEEPVSLLVQSGALLSDPAAASISRARQRLAALHPPPCARRPGCSRRRTPRRPRACVIRAILETLYSTGIRVSELTHPQASRRGRRGPHPARGHGQGTEGQDVPLTHAACDALSLYLLNGRPVLADPLHERELPAGPALAASSARRCSSLGPRRADSPRRPVAHRRPLRASSADQEARHLPHLPAIPLPRTFSGTAPTSATSRRLLGHSVALDDREIHARGNLGPARGPSVVPTRAATRHPHLTLFMRELERNARRFPMLKRALDRAPGFLPASQARGRRRPARRDHGARHVLRPLSQEKTTGARHSAVALEPCRLMPGTVRAFFSFLQRRGLILWNPVRDLRLPRARRLPRAVLSVSEAARLMNVSSFPQERLARPGHPGAALRLRPCAAANASCSTSPISTSLVERCGCATARAESNAAFRSPGAPHVRSISISRRRGRPSRAIRASARFFLLSEGSPPESVSTAQRPCAATAGARVFLTPSRLTIFATPSAHASPAGAGPTYARAKAPRACLDPDHSALHERRVPRSQGGPSPGAPEGTGGPRKKRR